jgi:hypothetical protein
MKSKDLNKACVSMWKNANCKRPAEKAIPIKPKWLRVDRAIIFLRSFSKMEFMPA